MSDVVRYKFSEFATITSSKRVHLSDYVEVGVPFYRSKEIIELANNQGISETLYISEEKYNEIKNKYPVPQIDDILITAVGTIGKIYLVKDVGFYFKDGNLIWVRDVNKEIININYLYYFLNSPIFQSNILKNNIGAVQKAITIDHLKSIELDLPTLEDQNNISNILKNIDQKIALNNQINEELEAMAKTLYDYWFVQFDFPDENGKPYKSSGGKMVYNDQLKREIPEGWGVENLSNFLTIKNGKDHKDLSDGNYPVYGSGGLMRKVEDYIFEGESVLIPRKGTLNNIMYVDEKFWTVDTMFYTDMKIDYVALYTYFSIKDIDFTKLNTGTGVPSMTASILYQLQIINPNADILKNFDELVRTTYRMIFDNRKQNQELNQLREWLLPMLMNGQVKVEE
ncbi:restriction endonuclease subunit S [Streptococcus sp. A34]|uniref:restriction endonuclease subunit S n=1 Tax=Streptococcus sp. A34 TaxID=3373130 RepID=UPI00374C92D9